MNRRYRASTGLLAFILIAASPIMTRANGIFHHTSSVNSACLAPAELGPLHLYGLWRAEFEGLPQGATLLLERHPQWQDSLSGGINRNGLQGRISAEIENGEFTLEESLDGQHIHATWEGRVVDASCGREIRGLWRDAKRTQAVPFTLRKLPGWN